MENATERQAAYRLLALLFLYPTPDRLQTLRAVADLLLQQEQPWPDGDLDRPFRRLLQDLRATDEYPQEDVESNYTALFTVKPAAPPYESYYLDEEGFARGWIAAQLLEEYQQAGLSMAPSFKEPPDHVAVELEFLSYLCGREAQAQEKGDDETRTWARHRRFVFLENHLGLWFARFSSKVRQAETLPLYTRLVDATQALIKSERAVVDSPTQNALRERPDAVEHRKH